MKTTRRPHLGAVVSVVLAILAFLCHDRYATYHWKTPERLPPSITKDPSAMYSCALILSSLALVLGLIGWLKTRKETSKRITPEEIAFGIAGMSFVVCWTLVT